MSKFVSFDKLPKPKLLTLLFVNVSYKEMGSNITISSTFYPVNQLLINVTS